MLVSTLQAGAHTLPRDARIHVGQAYGAAGEPEKRCEEQPLRAGNIRHMFARYHVLQPGEEHDHYLWFACGTRGTVTVRGKVFHWNAHPGNLLWTNYPDRRWREYGGAYSDDLSDAGVDFKRDK